MAIARDTNDVVEAFGLATAPFEAAPDPRFVHAHGGVQQVCAELLAFDLSERSGLFLISGAPGTGKSTLLHKIRDDRHFGTRCQLLSGAGGLSFAALVEAWCAALGIAPQAATHEKRRAALDAHLAARESQGETAILLLDDAEAVADGTLRKLCKFAGSDPGKHRLARIVLAARPALKARLARRNLSTVRQAVAFQTRMRTMAEPEVRAYIRHRLAAAGHEAPDEVFSGQAVEIVARATLGVPRLVNVLCRTALDIAAAGSRRTVSAEQIEASIQACLLRAQDMLAVEDLPPPPGMAAAAPAPAVAAGPGPPHAGGCWPIVVRTDTAARGARTGTAPGPIRPHRLARFAFGLFAGLVLGLAVVTLFPARLETPDTVTPGLLMSAEDDKARALEAAPVLPVPVTPIEARNLEVEPAVLAPEPPRDDREVEVEPVVLAPQPPAEPQGLEAAPVIPAPGPPLAGQAIEAPLVPVPESPLEDREVELEPAVLGPEPPAEARAPEAEAPVSAQDPSAEAQLRASQPSVLAPEQAADAQAQEAEPAFLAPKPPVKPQLLRAQTKEAENRDAAAVAPPARKAPKAPAKAREQDQRPTSWLDKVTEFFTSPEPPKEPRPFGNQVDR